MYDSFLPFRALYAALFLAPFLIYFQTRTFAFVNFDDPEYVSANLHVQQGLTADNVEWAFRSGEAANWFPVTRLSYLIVGPDAGLEHLVNALLHSIATIFLFAFLYRAMQSPWPSAFVGFVFALHPLHVESIAWIAERKDVLAALFWFWALWEYVRWTEKPSPRGYVTILALFCLGLMSKPSIVTLPFTMLLLDIWPLGRWGRFREKIPFFALSALSAVVTSMVQAASGAVEALPVALSLRVENAFISYFVYIAKMFWPAGLAVFYPYPEAIPGWQAAAAFVAIAGISILVFRIRYLAVGWFWFLITLLPMIGLVQVGSQARADRYTYVPMVGLLIMLGWGFAYLVRRWPKIRNAVAALAIAGCSACAILTFFEIQYWRNSETLFRHALDVTSGNYLAHHNLGVALADEGRFPEAIEQYQAAVQIEPNAANVETDYGNALAKSGRIPEAIVHYRLALRFLPDAPITHNDLANALTAIPGSMPEAIAEYQTALRLKPDYLEARNNLAQVQSNAAEMEYNQGVDLAKSGKPEAAIARFEEALRLKPDYVDAHNNLGVVLAGAGRAQEAISHFETALRIDPNSFDAHVNLGIALSGIPGRKPEAIRHFEAALRVKPDPEIRQMLDRLEKK